MTDNFKLFLCLFEFGSHVTQQLHGKKMVYETSEDPVTDVLINKEVVSKKVNVLIINFQD